MREVREDWDAYPSELQGEFVMFVVNLGLRESAPIEALPVLHWVRVEFEPGPSGLLPGPDDHARLEELETWLTAQVDEVDGVFAGRLTAAGRREFFVYLDRDRSEDLALAAMELWYDDAPEFRAREDSEWQIYREFLYPGPVEYQRVLNQRVVRVLTENEDMLSFPRPVRHWAAFLSEESAHQFAAFLVSEGFDESVEVEESSDVEAARPWQVRATRTHAVDLMSIDRVVMPVFLKARELGGTYDGWETEVVRAN